MTKSSAEHLGTMLRMNPLTDADSILECRNRFLGIAVKPSIQSVDADSDIGEQRDLAMRMVDNVRANFWTMPLETIRAHLDSVDLKNFPEIRGAADRLRLVATYRAEFPRLLQHPKNQLSLFNGLKTAVVAPPRQAGAFKERCLQEIAESGSLKQSQVMVKMMRKEFPALYQLESDFLGQILKLKHRNLVREYTGSSTGGGIQFGIPGWVIWIIVIFVIRLLVAISR